MSDATRHPMAEHITSAATQMEWIERVLAEGIRRPGSPQNARVDEWALQQFVEIGLHDVRAEPLDVPVWDYRSATLHAWPEGKPDRAIELNGFALPHTLAFAFFPQWLLELRRAFPALKTRLIALNVHDAVLRLTEGHCDLLLAYDHPSQPLQLAAERYEMLTLSNDLDGASEVGGLFLHAGERSAGVGALLARSRYLFIRRHRARFADKTLAELRGVMLTVARFRAGTVH